MGSPGVIDQREALILLIMGIPVLIINIGGIVYAVRQLIKQKKDR